MAFQMYVVIELKAGEVLINEGDSSDCLYILKGGELEIYKLHSESQAQRIIGHVYPGEMFGEMSFLDNLPRSATVKAKTDCRVYMINRVEFDNILKSQDQMVQNLVKTLSDRLRKAINQISY